MSCSPAGDVYAVTVGFLWVQRIFLVTYPPSLYNPDTLPLSSNTVVVPVLPAFQSVYVCSAKDLTSPQ